MSLLSILVLVPLFAGATVLLGKFDRGARPITALAAAVAIVVAVYGAVTASGDAASLQFLEFRPLFGATTVSWHLGFDGWTLLPMLAVVIAMFAATLTVDAEAEGASAWVIVIAGAALGAILSLNFALSLLFLGLYIGAIAFAVLELGNRQALAPLRHWLGGSVFGWCLLDVGAIVLALDMLKDPGTISFNYGSMLRLRQGLAQETPRFWLLLAGFAAIAGWFPFAAHRAALARALPAGLAQIIFTTGAALGFAGIVRFVLPVFPEASVAHAPLAFTVALTLSLYAGFSAWVSDDLRAQTAQLPALFAGVALAATFSLSPQASLGGIYVLSIGMAVVTLLWLSIAWLARLADGDVDWWVVKQYGAANPWLRGLLVLTLGSLATLPFLALFPGLALMLFGAFDLAIDSARTSKQIAPFGYALALSLPLLLVAAVTSRHLVHVLTAEADTRAAAGQGPKLQDKVAIAMLAAVLLGVGLLPNWLLLRSARSVQFTYERRLLAKDPIRALSYEESVLGEEPAAE